MKRLLLLFVLLFAVPAAFAQSGGNVLLTDSGVLYNVTAEWSHENPNTHATSASYLVLTVRDPESAPRRLIVPATMTDGWNSEPALAYDDDSGTVFIFWQYSMNAMASELRFISFDRFGNWSLPNTFETASWRFRRNLRIGLTKVAGEKDNTSANISPVPELNVHAAWWESSTTGERARYAMLTLRKSEVSIQVRDLADFVAARDKSYEVPSDFNRELFRHPAIFESAESDSVDVVFGDTTTNTFHRVKISPIGHGRIRVPVGKTGRDFSPPSAFTMAANTRIDAISPHPDRLVFFFQDEDAIHYIAYRNSEWTSVRKIRLDEGMTREMAVNALRGLVGAR